MSLFWLIGISFVPIIILSLRLKSLGQLSARKAVEAESSYLDAIVSTSLNQGDNFYFPGHGGGKFAPPVLRDRFGEAIFKMDLPELDSTDNLHNPRVR